MKSKGYDARQAHRPVAAVPVPVPAQTAAEEPKPKRRRLPKSVTPRNWKKTALFIVAIAIIAWLAYGYVHTKHQLDQLSNNTTSGQTETQKLVNQVGQLVVLPMGETPTIATVNDATKLKNQAFFANAQNGDKVLIYSKAGKAVLYRPSANKIIEYSTVNLSSGTGQ